MVRFLGTRLLAAIPVLAVVSIIVFLLLHLTPGDPATLMLGTDASAADIERLHKELGLDQPLIVQYGNWLSRVVRGDLGNSIWTHQPVAEAIAQRIPITGELTFLAVVISVGIALPIGIIGALRPRGVADTVSSVVALIGISLPDFFIAIVLIYVFALGLRWLPAIGFVPFITNPFENLKSVLMPAVALGLPMMAVVARLTRSSMLEVLAEDYVRTARAKGLSEAVVVIGHALKNGLIPIVTVVGLQVGALLGGAVIVETVFALPGVGRLIVDSIFSRDFPIVQGVVLVLGFIFVTVNLVVDAAYAWIDPRIRY